MATAAERLTAFTTDLAFEAIPAEVVEAAKYHFLDTLGCGLAAHALGIATEGRETMRELGGDGHASVIGGDAMPAANAAFANAMICHGLDFDDTHAEAASHVSVVVSPAALAAAEAAGAGGRELLCAVVAGNEVVIRVGMAASGDFHRRGFHPTAICGVFGAAAAASRLGGLAPDRATSALGIAGSMASGIFAYLEDATATKPIHPGWAAHGGLVAARLAAHGAEGPPSVLEARFGLYHTYVERRDVDLERQLGDLGSRWETPLIAYKPFPACHFMHGAMDAAAEAVAGARLDPDEIEEVVVSVPKLAVQAVLEPVADKLAPRTDYEAKFSLQYSVAAMLVHGRVDVQSYTDEAIRDARVLELAKRVTYEVKEYPSFPAALPGGARIRTRDGRTLEADLAYQRGCPENPMPNEALREKFRANASLALPDASVEALEETVLALEDVDDLRSAFAVLAAEQVAA